ncbi:MAG: SulP family inorganic anion transporter [Syntrophales bacterium]|nr:SulP family inorganic anion transporter [Syntrophales bacterium]
MTAQSAQTKHPTPVSIDDLWGGLAAMLVALPSSIAFGVLVYSALGTGYAGEGALAGIIGAAAIGLIAPLFGRTNGLISAPCAPAAAVLSALVVGLLAGGDGGGLKPVDILPLMALTALFSAGFQVFYGAIGGGRLIKYVPYPVVSGYLSGVGVIIALGQLPKLFGFPKATPLFQGLISPELWKWQSLLAGIVTIAVMAITPRITKKVPAAILGLLGGIVTYFVLATFSPELLSLQNNPLVIGPIHASGSFLGAVSGRLASLFSVNVTSIKIILVPALTLSVLLSIDTLKTCVVLDALTRSRHKSDRELIGQGIANVVSFLAGGMPGAGTMGPTLVNVTSGGRTYRSGVIEGALVVMTLLLLGKLVAWVPIGALAGILLAISWRMLDFRNMSRLLRHPAGRLDFAVIAFVILVAVTVDLIAASGVGIALAIILFIRDQIRGSVIRRKRGLDQVSSKTKRLDVEREILRQSGGQAVFCELQGNLFFGTTDQLFTQLESDLRTKRFILLDMRRVQSMDYTAAHLFEQMQAQLEERGGRLLFTGMPSTLYDQRDFERYLAQLGVVRQGGGVMISETLDGALEWMEERILEDSHIAQSGSEQPLELKDFELFHQFDESTLSELASCVTELSAPQGQKVFSQGDPGDKIFLVRRGSVRILLPLKGNTQHHLATIGQGDFFGELSFLDGSIRSATVEAKVPTDLYALSRSSFNAQSHANPVFGVQVFARLALAIAKRLRHTDAELQVLEER